MVDTISYPTTAALAPAAKKNSSEDSPTPYQSEAADLFNEERDVIETTAVDDLVVQGGPVPSPHIRLDPGSQVHTLLKTLPHIHDAEGDRWAFIRKLPLRDMFPAWNTTRNILLQVSVTRVGWCRVVPFPAIFKPKPLWIGEHILSDHSPRNNRYRASDYLGLLHPTS
ncbi:hypothetical protein D9619_009226 [Psilocybe cf. subviscida]|uniref:Uncharacterized protein n=1 Tax=Psilocybe cf. subviscida TaxID=2480587 RepID=A0A8H5FAY2_9AGAR|nr:hypothetical protein D9619_009226 [Psilocybe cf. subviscida]